jgi:hypothetical protein
MREIRMRYMMTVVAADIGIARAQSAVAAAAAAGAVAAENLAAAGICVVGDVLKK